MALICMVFALGCFLVSGFGLATGKVNMVAIGLAFLTGAFLLGGGLLD